MENIVSYAMECGHVREWKEIYGSVDPTYPWVGMVVFCPDCNEDQEVVSVDPSVIIHDEVHNRILDSKVQIAFQAETGLWGFIWGDLEEFEYSSPREARSAAEEAMQEETAAHVARKLGYTDGLGQGDPTLLLKAIARGEVAVVLLPDEQRVKAVQFLSQFQSDDMILEEALRTIAEMLS